MDITPFIKREEANPIYLQVYQFFREKIESGSLVAGTKLPSIRQLSGNLQVSKNTVETAYQQLVAEGYIEGKEKSGLYVVDIEDFHLFKDKVELKEEEPSSNSPRKESIDFQYGDIDLEHFPYKVWKKCLVEAIEQQNQEVFSYGERSGHGGLRKEIAAYLNHARGVSCTSDQIILCAGTQTAVSLLCLLLGLPNERVAIENPGYDGVRFVFESHQCQLMSISLEEDGIHLDELEDTGAVCVYVTPSHQFPIGMIMPIQKRIRLLQWAERNDSYIIEDDYDSEFRYQGHPIPSLKSLDTNDRVIYLGTFSKAFLPAARVSYLVLPKSLADLFQTRFSFYNQTVSPLIQETLYRFMKEEHFSRHIRKMRKIYLKKQRVLLDSIERYLGNQVRVIGQNAGLHLLLDFKGMDANLIVEKANSLGVNVYLTEKYWMRNQPGPQQPLMLGFGGLKEAEIKTGIQKLASVLAEMS